MQVSRGRSEALPVGGAMGLAVGGEVLPPGEAFVGGPSVLGAVVVG